MAWVSLMALVGACGRLHFAAQARDDGGKPPDDAEGFTEWSVRAAAGDGEAKDGEIPDDGSSRLPDATAAPDGNASPSDAGSVGGPLDAGADSDGDAGIACVDRIPPTGNEYVPRDECLTDLDAARIECNADPSCVLNGWDRSPGGTGVNDTGACSDGGGETGLRQWLCSPRDAIPEGHSPI